jgi:hypothetical protein
MRSLELRKPAAYDEAGRPATAKASRLGSGLDPVSEVL